MKIKYLVELFLLTCAIACSNPNQNTVITTNDTAKKYLVIADKNSRPVKIKYSAFALDCDPLCGTKIDGSFKDTTLYKGKLYSFCCGGCKAAFLNNPDYILANRLW